MGRSIIITPSSPSSHKRHLNLSLWVVVIACWLVACNVQSTPGITSAWTKTPGATVTFTVSPTTPQLPTFTKSPRPSEIPTLTSTSTRVPTLTPTLAPLELFTTRSLRPDIQPQAYLEDICSYLQMRWSAEGSQPGTVVVPIMFHSIVQNGTLIADPNKDITADQFTAFVTYARHLGFETITTQELLDFLTNNSSIPPRSMMIIVDDRRPGLIREWLMPVLEEYDWTVTAAYIADPNSLDWAWNLMEQLFTSGRIDVQSHGYTGNVYIVPETPIDKIKNEIWNSTPVLDGAFWHTSDCIHLAGREFHSIKCPDCPPGRVQAGIYCLFAWTAVVQLDPFGGRGTWGE